MPSVKSSFWPSPSPKSDFVTLGTVKGRFWRKETLSEGQLNHHVHIVGASGYGKTVLLSHLIEQRIKQGKGLLFIDLKGDMDTLLKLTQYAIDAGRSQDLCTLSLSEKNLSVPYNILGEGNPTQLRDRIVGSLNWSEEYYKNQAASFLLRLFIVLTWFREHRNEAIHLGKVLECIQSTDELNKIGNQIPASEPNLRLIMQDLVDFSKDKDSYRSLQGLRTQIESIVLSDFGSLMATSSPGINLFDAYKESKIIFLFLDSRRYGETAKAVGRFILQDLKYSSGKVDAEIPKKDRKPFSVIIDEFADLASEDFIGFLDRARSSKTSVVVSHQELCDLNRISPEFAGRLMGNTSTLYSFLQKRPESAETIASIGGTRKSWKETLSSDKFMGIDVLNGAKSHREVEEFNIHPNVIKSLEVGVCVCIKKYPTSKAYLVNIAPEGDSLCLKSH